MADWSESEDSSLYYWAQWNPTVVLGDDGCLKSEWSFITPNDLLNTENTTLSAILQDFTLYSATSFSQLFTPVI